MIGQSILFGTLWGLPTVSTENTTNLDTQTLTANGNVTNLGPGETTVTRGFYIGTNSTYTSNTKHTLAGTQGTGTFSYSATGLADDTTHYITAFAIGDKGESVGITVSVVTVALPTTITVYTAGQSTGFTYDQCFCGTANGNGTLGASYMEIYAPYWGGGGWTSTTSFDLTFASYVEVDYTVTAGIPSYMNFNITTGHNGSNPTSTTLITGGGSPTQAYSSGAQIPVNFPQASTVALSLGNASSSRVRITRIEYV